MPEKQESDQPSTDLAERPLANPLAKAEAQFSPEEREQIAKFLNVSAADTALVPFLAIASQLELDPFRGEIWLIKGRRKDKESGQYVDFYRPAVGRDGLLKYARDQKTFKGIRFGVVCANDTFEVEDDGWETKVLHRMASLGSSAEKGHESRWRGAVLGAWAKLYFRDDRPALFYYAPAHEHVRTRIKDGEREFEGAWSYTSTMIVKSAVSYVLRLGFGVTGVVPFDELRVDDPQMAGEAPEHEWGGNTGSLDEDPDVANAEYVKGLDIEDDTKDTLIEALSNLNELAPFSWTPAKLRMRLGSDCDEPKAKAVLSEVEGEYKTLRDRQKEAEDIADAVEVALARDVKPPVEVHTVMGEGEPEWILVEDVIFDEEAGKMTFKLAGGREQNYSPTAEVEVRSPQSDDEQG